MFGRAILVSGGVLGLGCPAATSDATSPSEPQTPASGQAVPAVPVDAVAPRRAPDLSWDSAVGWEPRFEFPAGVTSRTRQEWVDFANLRYLPWDDAALAARMLGARPGFESMALVVPPERLCEPALRDALARMSPTRLLLRLDGAPSEAQWDCLERLGSADLYLTACPDDGTSVWPCDGDADLDAIARRPALRDRVRGLGVGFGEPRHWRTLATFPRLSMLTVRGPVVREAPDADAQAALCALPDLAYVDLLDANEPGSNPRLPVACVLGLETYEAWRLLDDDPEWGVAATPVPEDVPCRLRRVMLWSADDTARQVLSRCPGLTLEVIDGR